MFKLSTKLSFFRYNSYIQTSVFDIEWFKYLEDEEEDVVPFTYEELNRFQAFAVERAENFGGPKDYQKIVHEDDVPYLSVEDSLPMQVGLLPRFFILGKTDKTTRLPHVCNAAIIFLTNRAGNDFYGYNLDFSVIGVRK